MISANDGELALWTRYASNRMDVFILYTFLRPTHCCYSMEYWKNWWHEFGQICQSCCIPLNNFIEISTLSRHLCNLPEFRHASADIGWIDGLNGDTLGWHFIGKSLREVVNVGLKLLRNYLCHGWCKKISAQWESARSFNPWAGLVCA